MPNETAHQTPYRYQHFLELGADAARAGLAPAPDFAAALNKSIEGRTELEIDRNYWKSEAKRYKQLLMDMLGKEVE